MDNLTHSLTGLLLSRAGLNRFYPRATLVLIVSAASVLFVNGSNTSVASQRESQVISVADQQIEMIREEVKTEGFAELARWLTPYVLLWQGGLDALERHLERGGERPR